MGVGHKAGHRVIKLTAPTRDRLQVPPGNALYVGDAPWDVECARRAGVTSVGALWGCVDPDALMASRPDQLWREPQEALGLLRP